jgi:glycine/D-amino acid oxidase-like deaminating enzyme
MGWPEGKAHSNQRLDLSLVRSVPPKGLQDETLKWGESPWTIDFKVRQRAFPESVDFAIVGAGFTGLAAAAWLRRLAPEKSVVVFEADRIGAGASGRTGGMALAESAAGDLPGLGNVLSGLERILAELDIDCDLSLPGAFEIGRGKAPKDSPIQWNDSGTLRVVKKVPGGTLDPGNSWLASRGWQTNAAPPLSKATRLHRSNGSRAPSFILSLMLSVMLLFTQAARNARPGKSSSPPMPWLSNSQLLPVVPSRSSRSRFSPSRWKRSDSKRLVLPAGIRFTQSICRTSGGAAVTTEASSSALASWMRTTRAISGRFTTTGNARNLFESIERRIHNLHPELREIEITHRWGGPILFRENWHPVFMPHPESKNAIVLGAYAGHGVALSVYLGAWAAETLLGRRKLPSWGSIRK